MKKCSNPKCKIQDLQSLDCFYRNKASKDGHESWCKSCHRNRQQTPEYKSLQAKLHLIRSQNPGYKDEQHKKSLKRFYGITVEQYNEMFEKQQGKCGICDCHQKDLKYRLAVDHSHETGEIRGLLCKPCNLYLAHYEELKLTFISQINAYLTRSQIKAV